DADVDDRSQLHLVVDRHRPKLGGAAGARGEEEDRRRDVTEKSHGHERVDCAIKPSRNAILRVSTGGPCGLHLSRAQGEEHRRAARDSQRRRKPGRRAGLLADEQGPPAAGALQCARHSRPRASRRGRHRQAGDQSEDARAEEAARRRARLPRPCHAQERAPADSPLESSDPRARRAVRRIAMAEHSSYPPGTFCWPELSTSDQKAAVAFYRTVFGWDLNDIPMGPDSSYSIFQIRGLDVAAAAGQQPQEREHGVPPHWNSYVSVANVDDSAKKAQALGAKVLAGPFDVMEVGRMAVIQDPTGAVFQLWQPKSHIGAKVLQEPGALTWTELATPDTEAAKTFYTSLFGWKEKTSSSPAMTY